MGKQLQRYVPERMHLTPDLDEGHSQHVLVQLSASAGTVTKVDIPGWATYIQLYAVDYICFYAVDENPVPGTAQTGTDLAAAHNSVGDVLPPGYVITRLPAPAVQEIRLASASSSAQVYVSFSAGALTVR